MDRLQQHKLHEIVESVKEDYLLNVIEESTNEVEVLRTKKFLNETSAIVESMILEEGIKDIYGNIKDMAGAYASAMKEGLGAFGQGMKEAFDPNSYENKKVRQSVADDIRPYSEKAANFIEPDMDTGEKVKYKMDNNPRLQKLNQAYAKAKAKTKVGLNKMANFSEEKLNQITGGRYNRMTPAQRQAFLASLGVGGAGLAGAAGYGAYEAMQPDDSILDQIQDYIQ